MDSVLPSTLKAVELEAQCNANLPGFLDQMEKAGVKEFRDALNYFVKFNKKTSEHGYYFPLEDNAVPVYYTYRWRKFRAVYCFDSSLAEALIDQATGADAGEEVPVALISKLPFDCISIKLPAIKKYMHQYSEEVSFTGDIIITTQDDKGDKSLMVGWIDDHDYFTTSDFLLIPGKSIGECFEEDLRKLLDIKKDKLGDRIVSEAKKIAGIGSSYKKGDISVFQNALLSIVTDNPEDKEIINFSIDSLNLSLIAIQCVLYINSSKSDIADTTEKLSSGDPNNQKKMTRAQRRQATRYIQKKKLTIKDVGYNIGITIRQHMQKASDEAEKHGIKGDKAKIRAYIRRGHWHHYWKGPKDGPVAKDHDNPLPGEKYLILKYRLPEFVGGETDKATAFPVK